METPPIRMGKAARAETRISMKITSAASADAQGGSSGDVTQLRFIRSYVRSLGDGGAHFSVVRDPDTQRFVVQVVDPESKAVLDQFPAEDIVKRQAARQALATGDNVDTSPGGQNAATEL
jgi:hypothetical protein